MSFFRVLDSVGLGFVAWRLLLEEATGCGSRGQHTPTPSIFLKTGAYRIGG